MTVLASDLDRTLFPNGEQVYDESMDDFRRLVNDNEIILFYVTGRNIEQIKEGISKYDPPEPNYVIAEVGTRVYSYSRGRFTEDSAYIRFIETNTRNWNRPYLVSRMESLKQLSLQEEENQNRFKISLYLHDIAEAEEVVEKAKELASLETPDAHIIYSVDETKGLGLVDLLPKKANKLEALEFVRNKIGAEKEDIIYAGDSGNDLIPLTSGYRAILVKNAIPEVRQEVREAASEKGFGDLIYFARGGFELNGKELNGNYVSGIIEGLDHFGIVG